MYWAKEASDGSALTHSNGPENRTGECPRQLSSALGQGFTSAAPAVLSLLPKVSVWVFSASLGLLVFLKEKSKKNVNHHNQMGREKKEVLNTSNEDWEAVLKTSARATAGQTGR